MCAVMSKADSGLIRTTERKTAYAIFSWVPLHRHKHTQKMCIFIFKCVSNLRSFSPPAAASAMIDSDKAKSLHSVSQSQLKPADTDGKLETSVFK